MANLRTVPLFCCWLASGWANSSLIPISAAVRSPAIEIRGRSTGASQPADSQPFVLTNTPVGNPGSQLQAADPGARIDALLEQALAEAEQDKFAAALRLVEKALGADPKHRQALLIHARLLNERAFQLIEAKQKRAGYRQFGKAADSMRILAASHDRLNPRETKTRIDALYNEACMYAVLEQDAAARDSLQQAWSAGFTDFEQLESDEDLASVRKTPQFRSQVARHLKDFYRQQLAAWKTFDFDFRLKDVEGKPLSLAGLKGKLVLVNLWGTWCPHCRHEIPHLIKLRSQFGTSGLEVVGLNFERVDENDPEAIVRAFHKRNQLNYPCALGTDKLIENVPQEGAFPRTLFIDRKGKPRLMIVGYHTLWELEAIVRLLLGPAP